MDTPWRRRSTLPHAGSTLPLPGDGRAGSMPPYSETAALEGIRLPRARSALSLPRDGRTEGEPPALARSTLKEVPGAATAAAVEHARALAAARQGRPRSLPAGRERNILERNRERWEREKAPREREFAPRAWSESEGCGMRNPKPKCPYIYGTLVTGILGFSMGLGVFSRRAF